VTAPVTLGPYAFGAVHQGETLDLLRAVPDESVDMLCTDPPYSSGGFTRGDRTADPRQKYCQNGDDLGRISFTGDNRDGRSWCYWSALWLSEAQRTMRSGAYALMFCDWRQLPLATDAFQAGGLVWRGIIVWDKGENARGPHPGYFRHQAEYVVWGTKGGLPPEVEDGERAPGGPWRGVMTYPVKLDDKHHMTGKPTPLMRELVSRCKPGGVVLDPFAGSGTTIVACDMESRRGVGFEVAPANVRISNERIAASRSGIEPQARAAGQVALFEASA